MQTRWNVYRGDWYVQLYDQNNNLVVNMPLIGSPPNANIYLFPGVFQTSKILYRVYKESFEVTP